MITFIQKGRNYMRKKVLLAVVAVLVATAVTGFVYAESRIEIDAELIFTGATDDRVILSITNWGRKAITISEDAFYIDEVGSPGSWECAAEEPVTLGPRQARYIEFEIERAVAHGDNSILAFFFEHNGDWYLAKTGPALGFECFEQHN